MNSWKDKFPKDLQEKIAEVDEMISGRLNEITEQELYNQQRVLELYRKHRVAEEDLVGSTGYGYDDVGRDKLEEIFAEYFKTEDALVRRFRNSRNQDMSFWRYASGRYALLYDRNAL